MKVQVGLGLTASDFGSQDSRERHTRIGNSHRNNVPNRWTLKSKLVLVAPVSRTCFQTPNSTKLVHGPSPPCERHNLHQRRSPIAT